MNWAYVHLLLNHIPVLGVGFGLLLMAVGMARGSHDLKRASLGVFVLVAILAIPVYLTGEPAEEIVEHLPGVSEAAIEEHEEWALLALGCVEVLGLAALLEMLFTVPLRNLASRIHTITLVLSLLATGMLFWTAVLGGRIHHAEIRSGPWMVRTGADSQVAPGKSGGDDEGIHEGREAIK